VFLGFALVMKINIIYATRPFLWIGKNNFTTANGIQMVPADRWVMPGWYLTES
jgi:hypothetical protein